MVCENLISIKEKRRDFPGGPVVKNSPHSIQRRPVQRFYFLWVSFNKEGKAGQCIFRVHAKQKCLIRNNFEKKKVKVAQSCLTSQHYGLVHGILQGRILESVPISFSRGSNPGLPHCRRILYHLSHQGSPRILEYIASPFSRGSS